jgi:chemotaxis protein histidine kinase CheA
MVVICHAENRQIGLVVGELIGQQQVVIKTLGERFEKLKGIAGAAILGDGRVGLILEMTGLALAHEAMRLPAVSRSAVRPASGLQAQEPDEAVTAQPPACEEPPEVEPKTDEGDVAAGVDGDAEGEPVTEPALT